MQVATNMFNNKVDLSKMNAQFASGKVNPDDSTTAMKELNVVDGLLADDTQDKIMDLLSVQKKAEVVDKSTVTKFDVAQSLLDTVRELIEVTMDIAVQTINGNILPPGALEEFEEKYRDVTEEHTKFLLVRHTKIGDGYIFDGENIFGGDRKESQLTFEDGELLYNGAPVNDGTVEDIEEADDDGTVEDIEEVDEGTDESVDEATDENENGMSNSLQSLLDDFASDIFDGDMSNMEAYFEKLKEYKDIILNIQVDSEYKDPAVAIEKYKRQEVAYEACLAMQPNILQPTLSDYVV